MSTKQPTVPRGIRNNNPLNIRLTATRWVGMRAKQEDKGFCQFNSMAYGWRAAFLLLFSYYYKHGLETVRAIISRWAPPTDGNNTEAYIASVVADIRYATVDDRFTEQSLLGQPRANPWHWYLLGLSMYKVEQGDYGCELNHMLWGFVNAYKDYKLRA